MGDLVERLRSIWPTGCGDEGAGAKLMDEAADEIERLRARVAELEAFAREVTGV